MKKEPKEEKCFKPNELVLISNKAISAVQRKSYNVLLRKAQIALRSDKTQYTFRIPISELKEDAGIGSTENIRLKQCMQKLTQTQVEKNFDKKGRHWVIFNLLSQIKQKDNEFEYSFPPYVMDVLLENNYYTTLDMQSMKVLAGRNAVTIFEIASRFVNVQIPYIDLTELKSILGGDDYEKYSHFKGRCIEPAVNEINYKTPFHVTYLEKKSGKKVVGIKFHCVKKSQIAQEAATDVIPVKNEDDFKRLLDLLPLKHNKESMRKLIAKYQILKGYEYVLRNIEYTNKHAVASYCSYLRMAFKNNFALYNESSKQEQEVESEDDGGYPPYTLDMIS